MELELEVKDLKLKNQLVPAQNIISVGKIDNSTNNITNNTTNNINQQLIIINKYGQEKLDYLTSDQIANCLQQGLQGDVDLFKLIHYHPDHQDNKNLKIIDKNTNKYRVLKGYQNDKPIWEDISETDIIRNHIGISYDVYLKHMKQKGINNVTNGEMNHWKQVGEPTHKYCKQLGNGLVKVIKQHS